MTKEFCDHCRKEIPDAGWIRINEISGYYYRTHQHSTNPAAGDTLVFCSPKCCCNRHFHYRQRL